MSVDAQTGTVRRNSHRTLTCSIPIGSTGYTHADVSAAAMKWSDGATTILSKTLTAGTLTATTVGTNIVLTVALAPADLASLDGYYDVEWTATIDGVDDVRATGVIEVRKRI